jgi:chemotaxis protein MotB
MEEDPPMGIPEWVVTFGDMMSLLLTFFIMLVSMSEIKQEEKYQAMVESMKRQFGHDKSRISVTPGDSKQRPSEYRILSTQGRAKKLDTHRGGVPTRAPVGDSERVRIVREGERTGIGTVIFFELGSSKLTVEGKSVLDAEIAELSGKPQKIEIRGHTTQQLAVQGTHPEKAMELAYRRCVEVMQYLIEEHAIPSERIRLACAGASEPMYLSEDTDKQRQNPRVEVFLLNETVEQLIGTVRERDSQFLEDDTLSQLK